MAYHVVPHDIRYIIGHSEYTVRIKKEINQAAAHNGPVLIEGEEGSLAFSRISSTVEYS